jgi:ribosomal protein L34E
MKPWEAYASQKPDGPVCGVCGQTVHGVPVAMAEAFKVYCSERHQLAGYLERAFYEQVPSRRV